MYQYGSLNIAGVTFNVSEITNSATGLSALPTFLNLGAGNVLTPGTAQTITISNPTGQAAATGNISVTGASAGSFSFWSNCGASVAPGASCSAILSIPVDPNGTQPPSQSAE